MNYKQEIIKITQVFVKESLTNAEAGHDWHHANRVHNNARLILKTENGESLIVELAALLHDIADPKFYNGDEDIGPFKARKFLQKNNINPSITEHVVKIIRNISFKGGNINTEFNSNEFKIVQDADRLDAIGAIGIARAFNYGGYKNRELYNPNIAPVFDMNPEQYRKSNAPTINHFYEKLLLLKNLMNTHTAKQIAEERHKFMENYLQQFLNEWNGKI